MKHFIVLILGFNFFGCASSEISSSDSKIKIQDLRFSNTQNWFDYADRVLKRKSHLLEMSDEELAIVKPPPENTSPVVSQEIRELVKLQTNRTSDDVKRIVEEFGFCGWNMAGYQLGSNPKSDDEIIKFLYDISKIGFKLKKKFDRVRPSFLSDEIVPGIDVPQHASYPSNHSLEAHFLALVLADIYPELKSQMWAAADRIAKNREIAGVHYQSDSEAGAEVARLAHQKILNLQKYRDFLSRHKKSRSLEKVTFSEASSVCKVLIQKNVPR